MNRPEAIQSIILAYYAAEDSGPHVVEALKALGVTDGEIQDAQE